MQKDRNNELAVLMGNGVSIAANRDLFIPTLTKEIRKRFESADVALARLAKRGNEVDDPNEDFEALLGPLAQQIENLQDLRDVWNLTGKETDDVRKAIITVKDFVTRVQRTGTGHALDIIAGKSIAHFDHRHVVEEFLRAAISVVPGGVTVGNLNYDSLGMAGLINATGSHELCDMVWGYRGGDFDLLGTGSTIYGALMRSSKTQFPPRNRIRLVHPHGSLTWLRDPATGLVYRFDLQDLRALDIWAAWRDGRTEWEPQVVLTNQSAKSEVVTREPFNLAYEVLYDRLVSADRWLIAGYSFRDGCVNKVLARAWEARSKAPDVHVVTYGDSLLTEAVLDAVGFNPFVDSEDFLTVCRCGVADAPRCPTWAGWSGIPATMTA